MLTSIPRLISWLRSLLQRPQNCFTTKLGSFEQGDWLAELDLLQLANALQRSAVTRGGYDGRSFDLMFGIADVLEADHGWNFEQTDLWLERMGLWEEEF